MISTHLERDVDKQQQEKIVVPYRASEAMALAEISETSSDDSVIVRELIVCRPSPMIVTREDSGFPIALRPTRLL